MADGGVDHRIGDAIERGGLAVDDDQLGATALGSRDDAGDWIHHQSRPNGEEQIGLVCGLLGPLQVGGDEGLPKGDRGRFDDAGAVRAGRVFLASSDAIEHRLHGRAVVTRQASGLSGRAVDLHHQIGVDAADLVKLVDVLSNQGVEDAAFLKQQQCPMAVIGMHVGPQ